MGRIVLETSQILWTVICEKDFIEAPDSEEVYIAAEFNDKWNFLYCLDAIDGKHVSTHKKNRICFCCWRSICFKVFYATTILKAE